MARILKYNESKLKILRMIQDRQLKIGDKLPPERELVVLLGVSIISVHRALEELRESGMIRKVQGVGSFLERDITDNQSESILGIISINGSYFPDGYDMYQLEKARKKYRMSFRIFNVKSELDPAILDEIGKCERFILTGFVNDQWANCIGSFNKPMLQFGDSVLSIPISRVSYDWESCFRKCIRVLQDRGCRNISFLIPDPEYNSHAMMMHELFLKILSEESLPIHYDMIRFIPRDQAIAPVRALLGTFRDKIDAFVTVEPGSLLPLLLADVEEKVLFGKQLAVLEGKNYLPLDTEKCCPGVFRVYHGEPLLSKAIEILYTYPYSFIENHETYRIQPEVFA